MQEAAPVLICYIQQRYAPAVSSIDARAAVCRIEGDNDACVASGKRERHVADSWRSGIDEEGRLDRCRLIA